MLFIGRTMNKETQLGRKGDKKKRAIHGVAHIMWNLTVVTESFPR